MRVENDIRKCVGYIAIGQAQDSKPIGTVFFVITGDVGNQRTYAVTARHVIDAAIAREHESVWIRLNGKDKSLILYMCPTANWIGHDDPSVDLKVLPMFLEERTDHLHFPNTHFIDPTVVDEFNIGLGHEVFITGLFKHHHGSKRNIPIVRVGNIAALEEEQVNTGAYNRDAYLIECRSIGGLSGSPVFVQIDGHQYLKSSKVPIKPPGAYLFGIIHGHFDQAVSDADNTIEDAVGFEKMNTGIAIVTPVRKLIELLAQENVVNLTL